MYNQKRITVSAKTEGIILDSSMVEHSAVNRGVVGSSYSGSFFALKNMCERRERGKKKQEKTNKDRDKKQGSMVKRLRHRPFTAVTGVQIPLESSCERENEIFERHAESNVKRECADVAQLAEQLICNQQVNGSSPFIGFHVRTCSSVG